MKINQVETQVGITKKNIRFYEEQGLLAPRRNNDNGYRDYGPQEVRQLRQIKLLRKLGMPLEEIRRMQAGESTVADAMRRHLIALEREQRNLDQSMQLCRSLKDREQRLDEMNAEILLAKMEQLERAGTTFLNKQTGDIQPRRYVAPVVVTVLLSLLMMGLIALMLVSSAVDPAHAPPAPLLAILVAIPAVVVLGVVLALLQRIKEIRKGEADDAKNY
jgi:DNA-binding transcriptional MerR regulator